MSVEKIHLQQGVALRLVVPSSGFNQSFVEELAQVLKAFPVVRRAYLALKKVEDDKEKANLLFCLVLRDQSISAELEAYMDKIAPAVLKLFDPHDIVDFVLLNSLANVESTLAKLHAQIYPLSENKQPA